MALTRPRARAMGTTAPLRSETVFALGVVSAALFGVRLYAAGHVGFGDSEALYAVYAGHPQPAYLDHPGLIGVVARAIGAGKPPSPERAHLVTSFFATLFPWIASLACLACGATRPRAFSAGLVVALVPEMAVGLFALTPDLLLASSWMGVIALAATALRAPAGSLRATVSFAAAGLLVGIACASKVSGLLLAGALVVAYLSRPARAHARTFAPWVGLAAGAVVFAPVVVFEARTGWPMLRHRLVDTQLSAGLSIRNGSALVFGQLLYLSPLVALLAVRAAQTLWRSRGDPVGALLFSTTAVPAIGLLPLCLWSRVAEPHWLAPALLALAPAAARGKTSWRRTTIVRACAVAAVMVTAVHAWVLIPGMIRLAPSSSYDARLDITNELYGWPEVARAVRVEVESLDETPGLSHGTVAVAAPHWVLCAQLEARLHGRVDVGCDTPVEDDFDGWVSRAHWRAADALVWVTDARFGPGPERPAYAPPHTTFVRIERGGRIVRVFAISVFSKKRGLP